MAISKVQNQQIAFTQRPLVEKSGNVAMERFLTLPREHYRNVDDIPDTVNNIRPEKGQGRLVNNGVFSSIPRFFANRYYDLKSVYQGYTGTANDHQLGRTNDFGLLMGGIGIASFLATKRIAQLPKRMEFIGLASFLTAMSLWPKIGIFGPGRIVHGFDADKRYIDDQGRNKSVFQDPNYVPFDLYRGDRKSENLSVIADGMGIAKGVPNREEMAKDQMRKIANQNHTLWMLTSGGAVPILTALMSCAVEKAYEPIMIANRSKKSDKLMEQIYQEVIKGQNSVQKKPYNVVTKQIEKFVSLADEKSSKVVTQTMVDDFVNAITIDAGHGVAGALYQDINALFDTKKFIVDEVYCKDLAVSIETKFQSHPLMKKGILNLEEIKAVANSKTGANLAEGVVFKDKTEFVNKLLEKVNQKISAAITDGSAERVKTMFSKEFLKNDFELLPKNNRLLLDAEVIEKINTLKEPLTEYLSAFKRIKEANAPVMGAFQDSQDAFFWKKLESTYSKIISPKASLKDLSKLMDNAPAVEKLMKESFEKIAADEELFKKTIQEIDKIKMTYLKEVLGEGNEGKYVDLIIGNSASGNATWNNRVFSDATTKADKFIELQSRIANNLKSSLNGEFVNLAEKVAGKGDNVNISVASREIQGQVGKIENFVTVCDKIIHSLDVYRRAHLYKISKNPNLIGGSSHYIHTPWVEELFEMAKKSTIAAKSNDIFAKFGTAKIVRVFQSYMNLIYGAMEAGTDTAAVKAKGFVSSEVASILDCNSLETLQHWINKFRNFVGDDPNNWQYPEFVAGDSRNYDDLLKVPSSRHRVHGKNLVELAEQAAKKRHNSGKWVRMFGGAFIGIWGLSVVSQFFFGKKDRTIPLEKDRLKAERLAERVGQ